jgi:hypothetical protein
MQDPTGLRSRPTGGYRPRVRPWWMTLVLGLCLFGTLLYLPYDLLFTPLVRAEEVWFGITLRGWSAKAGEVAHWLVYAVGAWGIWFRRPWLPIAAGIYMLQVAVAHLVWSELDPRGKGMWVGLLQCAVFVAAAVLFFRTRTGFTAATAGHAPASR